MKYKFGSLTLISVAFIFFICLDNSYSQDPVFNDSPGIDLEWISIQGGTFQMGNNMYGNEKPIHSVSLSSFEITKYEITNAQYCAFLNINDVSSDGTKNFLPYIKLGKRDNSQIEYSGEQFVVKSGKEHYPVGGVTWYGARAFCVWVSGRLPTEAEWEYAARGGKHSKGYKYSGSNNIDDVAWTQSNSGGTLHPVGTKQPNELGLYDMSGNAFEWCHDWFYSEYYNISPTQDPQGPDSGRSRVRRGGCSLWGEERCQVTSRAEFEPYGTGGGFIGFRCVR